jgi:hypothetical protein
MAAGILAGAGFGGWWTKPVHLTRLCHRWLSAAAALYMGILGKKANAVPVHSGNNFGK